MNKLMQPNLNQKRQDALLKIVKAASGKSAQLMMYASGLGAIALTPQADIPSTLASIAGGMGVNLLSGIIERVAQGKDIPNTTLVAELEMAISKSGLVDQMTTSKDIQNQIMDLTAWQQHIFNVVQLGDDKLLTIYTQILDIAKDIKLIKEYTAQNAVTGLANYEMVADKRRELPKTDLEFVRSLTKEELCELVLIPLFSELHYHDIRRVVGHTRYSNDIIYSVYDPIDGYRYVGVNVVRYPLTETVQDSANVRELLFQIETVFDKPFINPFDGQEISIGKVYVLTPYTISQSFAESIKIALKHNTHRINFVDGDKLLNLIREHIPSLLTSLPNPRLKYFQVLANRFLKNRIPTSLGSTRDELSLLDIYTGGALVPTTIEEAKYYSFIGHTEQWSGPELRELLETNPFVVVLADVGAGKTTLLQKLTLDFILGQDNTPDAGAPKTPLFISLSTIPQEQLESYDIFLWYLQRYIVEKLNYEVFDIERASECLLLLDGFDEVQHDHANLASYIQRLTNLFTSGIVLTSRPSRIPLLDQPFTYFRLRLFTNIDIKLFLEKWFPGNSERADALFREIEQNDLLLRFCRTPLMLTLYTILATKPTWTDLPTRKTDVYKAITSLLLGEWDQIRRVRNYFDVDIKEHCLELVAYQAHTHKQKTFKRRDFENLLDALFVQNTEKIPSPQLLLDELIFRSSLIRDVGNEGYEFVHLSFQEFFLCKETCAL